MDDDQTCRDHVLLLGMEQAFRGVTYTGIQTRDWYPQMDRVLDYVRRNDFIIGDLRQENKRLRAELAEYRREAERYRTALEQIVAPFEDLNFVSGNKLLTYIHDTATSALAADGVAEDV